MKNGWYIWAHSLTSDAHHIGRRGFTFSLDYHFSYAQVESGDAPVVRHHSSICSTLSFRESSAFNRYSHQARHRVSKPMYDTATPRLTSCSQYERAAWLCDDQEESAFESLLLDSE